MLDSRFISSQDRNRARGSHLIAHIRLHGVRESKELVKNGFCNTFRSRNLGSCIIYEQKTIELLYGPFFAPIDSPHTNVSNGLIFTPTYSSHSNQYTIPTRSVDASTILGFAFLGAATIQVTILQINLTKKL